MTGNALLAIVGHGHHDVPWHRELEEVIARHCRYPGYDPSLSLVCGLTAAGLIEIAGRAVSAPMPFRQPVRFYVEQFHSTSALAREWMAAREAAAFDLAVEEIVAPYAVDGTLDLDVVAEVTWGRPTSTS